MHKGTCNNCPNLKCGGKQFLKGTCVGKSNTLTCANCKVCGPGFYNAKASVECAQEDDQLDCEKCTGVQATACPPNSYAKCTVR